jgi:hypothetical protein
LRRCCPWSATFPRDTSMRTRPLGPPGRVVERSFLEVGQCARNSSLSR